MSNLLFAHRQHNNSPCSPGPPWIALRWTRPRGSRTPDDFPPCLLLTHSICKADCSLPKPPQKNIPDREEPGGRSANKRDCTIWGNLIDITCEWGAWRADWLTDERTWARFFFCVEALPLSGVPTVRGGHGCPLHYTHAYLTTVYPHEWTSKTNYKKPVKWYLRIPFFIVKFDLFYAFEITRSF